MKNYSDSKAVLFNNVFKDKKVLVTGHTGFKGSWLCTWLNKLGANVAGFSIDIPTNPSHFEVLNLAKDMKDYCGDIRDIDAISKVMDEFRPEIVFHLAAKPIVRQCYDFPKEAFETNVLGTINILECLKVRPEIKAGILITSDKCYDNVEWIYGYREDDRLGGKDPYSASKACAEIAFKSYYNSYFANNSVSGSSRITTVRAGNVIGGGDWADSRIIPDCIKAWAEGDKVAIRNPDSTRPWQHVLEPLSGYLTLAQNLLEKESEENNLSGESFNFGPASEVIQPVSELITEMKKVWKNGEIVVDSPNSESNKSKKEANLLKLCCDKALAQLDWKALLSFEETISLTASWYYNYYNKHRANPALEKGDVEVMKLTLEQIDWFEKIAQERDMVWTR